MKKIKRKKNDKVKGKKLKKNITIYTPDNFDEEKLKGFDKPKKDKKNEKRK